MLFITYTTIKHGNLKAGTAIMNIGSILSFLIPNYSKQSSPINHQRNSMLVLIIYDLHNFLLHSLTKLL